MPESPVHLDTEGGVLCYGLHVRQIVPTPVTHYSRELPSRLPAEVTCPDCAQILLVGARAYGKAIEARRMAPWSDQREAMAAERERLKSVVRFDPARATSSCGDAPREEKIRAVVERALRQRGPGPNALQMAVACSAAGIPWVVIREVLTALRELGAVERGEGWVLPLRREAVQLVREPFVVHPRAAAETLALMGKLSATTTAPHGLEILDREERLRRMQSAQNLREQSHLRLYAAHLRRAFERRGFSVSVSHDGSRVNVLKSPAVDRDLGEVYVKAQDEALAFTRVDLGMGAGDSAMRWAHAGLHRGGPAKLCGCQGPGAVSVSFDPGMVNCPTCLHRLGPKLPLLTQIVADLLGLPLEAVELRPYTGRAWIEVRIGGLPIDHDAGLVVHPVLAHYFDAATAGKDHDPTCAAVPYAGWKVGPAVSGGPVEVTCACGFVLGTLAEETAGASFDWPEDLDSIVPGGAQGGWVAIGRRALREAREAGEAHAKAEPDSHDAWLANPHPLGSGLWAAWREGLWGELPPAHRLRILAGCLQGTGRAAFDRAIRTTPLTAGQLDAIVTPLRSLLAELEAEHKALGTTPPNEPR